MLCWCSWWQLGERAPKANCLYLHAKVAFAVAGGLAALFIRNRMGSGAEEIPCRRSTLLQQLKAQAPLLLQMCRLASSAY